MGAFCLAFVERQEARAQDLALPTTLRKGVTRVSSEPMRWPIIRDLAIGLLLAGVAGLVAALFSSPRIGFLVAICVGVLLFGIYYVFAPEEVIPSLRPRRRGFRPGQKLNVDFGVSGDAEGVFVGLASPPANPKVRVQLHDGTIITVPRETVAPVPRLRGSGRRFLTSLRER